MGVNMYMPEEDKKLFDILNSGHVNTITNKVLWGEIKVGKFFSKENLDNIDPEIFKEDLIKAKKNMIKNKYYTPDIEDIHIGYELEFLDKIPQKNGWKVGFVTKDDTYDFLSKWLDKGGIRVPYLTKEQIESEGWKFQHQGGLNGGIEGKFLFIKDVKGDMHQTSYGMSDRISFYLIFDKEIKIVKQSDSHVKETVFKGSCPSINEFRTICKLLKIN